MNLDYLAEIQDLLSQVEPFIHSALNRAVEIGYDPNDALRGLVISRQEAEHLLTRGPMANFWPDTAVRMDTPVFQLTPQTRIADLASIFNLTTPDISVLVLCLAPDFDRRYERLYGYLQDDVSQRWPTINLMMNLLGQTVPQRFAVWERLMADKPLRYHGLVTAEPDHNAPTASSLSMRLKVEHRLVSWLMGDSQPDERLKDSVTALEAANTLVYEPAMDTLYNRLSEDPMVYLLGREGIGRSAAATELCARAGLPLISIDLKRLAALDFPFESAWKLALREAYLAGGAVLLRHWEHCLNETGQPPETLWQALLAFPKAVFLCGREPWEPHDTTRARAMIRISFALPDHDRAYDLWNTALARHGVQVETLEPLVSKYRMTPVQIARAVNTAVDLATSADTDVTLTALYAGAKAHSSLRIGRMAKHVMPRHNLADLILPHDRLEQLRELCTRAEHAYVVQELWGFSRKINPKPRISALFSGESGTGKTMAADAIANELSLPLYRIDLSSVVSKYIGETEKNLSTIFEEAQSSNSILFFDEADAIFGKRSEVKDAHDRYANIEIAYLLQQIEDYDGIALLATNLRQNLDTAFTRRLDFVIDFPFPEPEHRRRIWVEHFPAEVPLAADIDFRILADRYPLAGGNIRNVAIASAYLAAADGGMVTMHHITSAIRREHQKIGRLITDEF